MLFQLKAADREHDLARVGQGKGVIYSIRFFSCFPRTDITDRILKVK